MFGTLKICGICESSTDDTHKYKDDKGMDRYICNHCWTLMRCVCKEYLDSVKPIPKISTTVKGKKK